MEQALPAVTLVLAVVAILRSPRKLHTAIYIVGAELIFALVGTGVGFVVGNAASAGTLAGLTMEFGGIAASIERIWRYRKTEPSYPVKRL